MIEDLREKQVAGAVTRIRAEVGATGLCRMGCASTKRVVKTTIAEDGEGRSGAGQEKA